MVTMMKTFEKTVKVGTLHGYDNYTVKITATVREATGSRVDDPFGEPVTGQELSISGECGRDRQSGSSFGQIVDTLRNFTDEKIQRLCDIWDEWHLNAMTSGCVHQLEEQWTKRPIDPSKPLNAYGRFFEGQKQDSWNMLSWVPQKEHQLGLLSRPCTKCEYKFGTKWLYRPLPDGLVEEVEEILEYIENNGPFEATEEENS